MSIVRDARRTHSVDRMSSLQRDILRTLLYFDIFDHPLTADEVLRFLPRNSVTADAIEAACGRQPLASLLLRDGQYIAVGDRDHGRALRMLRERPSKERRARDMMKRAGLMTRVVGSFPFVRGVFLTGELSKGVATQDSDVDLLVVTAPGRVWIARTLLIAFKKIFLLNSKRYLCLNHIVSEDGLTESARNRYIAVEIGTVLPMLNSDAFDSYQRSNAWIRSYLPNLTGLPNPPLGMTPLFPRFLRSILEAPLTGRRGEQLDAWLMERWNDIWRRRYPGLSEAERHTLFRCERNISTAYVGDFQPKVLRAYDQRLQTYGLDAEGHRD